MCSSGLPMFQSFWLYLAPSTSLTVFQQLGRFDVKVEEELPFLYLCVLVIKRVFLRYQELVILS